MRKNIFIIALLIVFVFTLSGCSSNKDDAATLPDVQVFLNDKLVTVNGTTNMIFGDKILIVSSHKDGIKTTNFRVGTGELQNLKEDKIQVVVPESYSGAGKFSLNIYAESTTGVCSLWEQYSFEMKTK